MSIAPPALFVGELTATVRVISESLGEREYKHLQSGHALFQLEDLGFGGHGAP